MVKNHRYLGGHTPHIFVWSNITYVCVVKHHSCLYGQTSQLFMCQTSQIFMWSNITNMCVVKHHKYLCGQTSQIYVWSNRCLQMLSFFYYFCDGEKKNEVSTNNVTCKRTRSHVVHLFSFKTEIVYLSRQHISLLHSVYLPHRMISQYYK